MENPLKKCNKCIPMVHSFTKDGEPRIGVVLKYFKQRKESSFSQAESNTLFIASMEEIFDGAFRIDNAPCIPRFVRREEFLHPLHAIVFDENNYPTASAASFTHSLRNNTTTALVKGKTVWFVPENLDVPAPQDNPLHPEYVMVAKSIEFVRMPIRKLPSSYEWVQIVPHRYFMDELLAKSNSHK